MENERFQGSETRAVLLSEGRHTGLYKRDNHERFISQGYAVLGCSTQDAKSHRKFIEKNALPFPLLCDTELKLVQQLGVYGEKKMAGRTYMGVFRTTFITDEAGIVTRIIGPKEIKVKDHAAQIL